MGSVKTPGHARAIRQGDNREATVTHAHWAPGNQRRQMA